MSDSGKREWRFYLDDMIEFAERALTYTDGFNETIWSITEDDLPELLPMLEELRNEVR